jgi:hypothetical protein
LQYDRKKIAKCLEEGFHTMGKRLQNAGKRLKYEGKMIAKCWEEGCKMWGRRLQNAGEKDAI